MNISCLVSTVQCVLGGCDVQRFDDDRSHLIDYMPLRLRYGDLHLSCFSKHGPTSSPACETVGCLYTEVNNFKFHKLKNLFYSLIGFPRDMYAGAVAPSTLLRHATGGSGSRNIFLAYIRTIGTNKRSFKCYCWPRCYS